MRSSVSNILVNSNQEPAVSRPDYQQLPIDHASILVLVRNDSDREIDRRIVHQIRNKRQITVTDKSGNRFLNIKTVSNYPVENNNWGDFQAHRKLLGLITVISPNNDQELVTGYKTHLNLIKDYQQTLIDSRLLVFNSQQVTKLPDITTSFIRYNSDYEVENLDQQLVEFFSSIFYVLELKRLDKRPDSLSLILAPFEHKDFVNVKTDSKQFKKRCLGRLEKQKADWCLQVGVFGDAVARYSQAADVLKSVNDWLWFAAACEGLCVASSLVLFPDLFSQNQDTDSQLGNFINHPQLLPIQEILKKYREAVTNYSKYQNAAIIEMEACFKATKIALVQNQRLLAAGFLQNVIFVNFNKTEAEKIARFEMLAVYYENLGLLRKSAFCLRLAASRYVSPQNPSPNWSKCYNLMLNSFKGYSLRLDPNEMCQTEFNGWSTLQIQLLQDLVVAAKRMGHSALATRHMTFLLQTMWQYLTGKVRLELCDQLRILAAQCEGSPVPLVLDGGLVIPPANLIHVPHCTLFVIQKLPAGLQPKPIQQAKREVSPFLFTPIQFGSLDIKNKKANKVLWVENEKGTIQLQLVNQLPVDITVQSMRILATGVVFETIPETITLRPEQPQHLNLTGIPKEHGELEILGYSMHTLGVKSNCKLKCFPQLFDKFLINVIPELPNLQIDTVIPKHQTSTPALQPDISVNLFNGESIDCDVSFRNTSTIPIEFLEISLNSTQSNRLPEGLFSWIPGQSKLDLQLPLSTNSSITILLRISSFTTFLLCPVSGSIHTCDTSFRSSSRHLEDSSSLRRNMNSTSFRSSKSSPVKSSLLSNHVIEAQMQVRYSGGEGYKADYCREEFLLVQVEVLNSLQIVNWDVLPAENYSQFYLAVDIINLTNYEMTVTHSTNKTIVIESNEKCYIPILCERCPLSKLTKFYENGDGNLTEIHDICSAHVARQIVLVWSLAAIDRHGDVQVNEIPFSADMLELIKMSPIRCNIYLNDELVQVQYELSPDLNKHLTITLEIENISNWTLKNVSHKLDMFLDYRNGLKNFDINSKVLILGAKNFFEDELEPFEKSQYSATAIFLKSGTYKLNISYQIGTQPDWKSLLPIEIIVNSYT